MSSNLDGHPIAQHVLDNDAMLAELEELRDMKPLGLRMRAQGLGIDIKQFSGTVPRVPMIVAIFEKKFGTHPLVEGSDNGEAAPAAPAPAAAAPAEEPTPEKAEAPAKPKVAKRAKTAKKSKAASPKAPEQPAPAKKRQQKPNGRPMAPKGPSAYIDDNDDPPPQKTAAKPAPAKRPSKTPAKAASPTKAASPPPPPPPVSQTGNSSGLEEYISQSFTMTLTRLDELTARVQEVEKTSKTAALYDQVETMRDQVGQLQSQMVALQEMMMALAPTLSMIYDSVQAGIHCLAKDLAPGRAKAVHQLFSRINADYGDNAETNSSGSEEST